MCNLLNYASIVVSVKYTANNLWSSVKVFALEKWMHDVWWKKRISNFKFIFYEPIAYWRNFFI